MIVPQAGGCGVRDMGASLSRERCVRARDNRVGTIEPEALASGPLLQNRELMTQGENLRF
jgi:hypothetical protein